MIIRPYKVVKPEYHSPEKLPFFVEYVPSNTVWVDRGEGLEELNIDEAILFQMFTSSRTK